MFEKDNLGQKEYGFNGVSTVKKKVKESQKLGLAGVMFWQIAGDVKIEHEKSLLNATKEMHKHHIVHRDIKCKNLLLDEKGKLKIIDFGSSELITNPNAIDDRIVGTLHYMPPEILSSKNRKKHVLKK